MKCLTPSKKNSILDIKMQQSLDNTLKLPNLFKNPNLNNIISSLQSKSTKNMQRHTNASQKMLMSYSCFQKKQKQYEEQANQKWQRQSLQIEKEKKQVQKKSKYKSELLNKTLEKHKQFQQKQKLYRQSLYNKELLKQQQAKKRRESQKSQKKYDKPDRLNQIKQMKQRVQQQYIEKTFNESFIKHQNAQKNQMQYKLKRMDSLDTLKEKAIKTQNKSRVNSIEKQNNHLTHYIKDIIGFQNRIKQVKKMEEQLLANKQKIQKQTRFKILNKKQSLQDLKKARLEQQDKKTREKLMKAQLQRLKEYKTIQQTSSQKHRNQLTQVLNQHSNQKEKFIRQKQQNLQKKLEKTRQMQTFKKELERLKQEVINHNFFLTIN